MRTPIAYILGITLINNQQKDDMIMIIKSNQNNHDNQPLIIRLINNTTVRSVVGGRSFSCAAGKKKDVTLRNATFSCQNNLIIMIVDYYQIINSF